MRETGIYFWGCLVFLEMSLSGDLEEVAMKLLGGWSVRFQDEIQELIVGVHFLIHAFVHFVALSNGF